MSERKTIYLCLAHMSDEGYEQKYVKEAFDTNWVVPMGPNVNAFEEDLLQFVTSETKDGVNADSRRFETTKVVCLSSGTAAVHLALLACGVGPGDEVCVQSFTFCASSHPITYCGAKPVFIGSEKETWNMDPELLEEAIKDRIAKTGKKPKAIVPVALYGMPYQIDKIMAIADKYDIPVVEDAAEGMGSRFNGQVLGTFGRYGVLSFNGNKMITTSGGGALICSPTPDPSPAGRGVSPVGGDLVGSPWQTADPTLYDILKGYSSDMRKNPTEAESVAWNILREEQTGYKFRRQHIIGDYIVDFVCLEKMLVIEIDGEYHNEWEQQIDDAARTEWLAIKGFRVMRFSNAQILGNPELFEREVKEALRLQNPLPTGEGWGGAHTIMWLATQARDAYPYYQHTAIGFNYRMSNVCAGIGRGQMKVLDAHLAHHKHVQHLYEELMKDIPGITIHTQPKVSPIGGDLEGAYDSNYWLCTMTIDPNVKVKGQENAYKEVIKTAVGGAAGVIHQVDSPVTDCQPNDNVEAMRVWMLGKKVECRPVWKPMHKQPVYADAAVYTNGVEEDIFKIGMCLPAGPYVTDDDVRYIVDSIKEAIEVNN